MCRKLSRTCGRYSGVLGLLYSWRPSSLGYPHRLHSTLLVFYDFSGVRSQRKTESDIVQNTILRLHPYSLSTIHFSHYIHYLLHSSTTIHTIYYTLHPLYTPSTTPFNHYILSLLHPSTTTQITCSNLQPLHTHHLLHPSPTTHTINYTLQPLHTQSTTLFTPYTLPLIQPSLTTHSIYSLLQ